MRFLNKLDRKFHRYAIHNLMLYVVFANAIAFTLNLLTGGTFLSKLMLIPQYVFQGEIWRLVTFVMIPPTTSPIFLVFALYFYYMIGQTLEHEWGSFKFNFYYFFGILVMIVSSLVFGTISSVDTLNLTLFLAFATLYPNYEIRIYFILPIKVKYLALISLVFLGISFFLGGFATKVSIIAGLANYLLFFGRDLFMGRKQRVSSISRKMQYKTEVKSNSHKHQCSVCGRTEKDDPNLEFRFCSKCEGYHEYCSEHLTQHEHK